MAGPNGTPHGPAPTPEMTERKCFVVSAFGNTPEDKVAHTQVLKHLVRKVLVPRRYEVIRADQIADEGLITNQIIEHLLEDDLVVADLTGLNPNVFYEMAVRHAARKPIVHLITHGIKIPFDVANMRAVQYALDDPDRLEEAQKDLEEKVTAIEQSGWIAAQNPITSVRNVAILRESDEPATREEGDVLAAVNQLRDEMQTLNRRIDPERQDRRQVTELELRTVDRAVKRELGKSTQPRSLEDIAARMGAPRHIVSSALERLAERDEAYLLENGWSEIPF
jgi:hypothetical protein